MDTTELEKWARQWSAGVGQRWLYDMDSPNFELAQAMVKAAREKIEALGFSITTDDWGNVVIVMPFKV